MKFYNNICKGCGQILQNKNPILNGYTPNLNFDLCQKCFKITNYGDRFNNLEVFEIQKYLADISNTKQEVILVIDVLNPCGSLIKEINKYIPGNRLTLLINKVDILPLSISQEKIIDWVTKIFESNNVKFKNISLVSSNKNINIDAIYEYINNSSKDFAIIGYSNVGKSSIIKSLYNSKLMDVKNTISNTIGTTTKPIPLDFGNKKIIDYPGFVREGNYQNILTVNQLNQALPKKEIKPINIKIYENSIYTIDNLVYIKVEKIIETNYQFVFSNFLKIERMNFEKNITINNWEWQNIIFPKKRRYDLFISGLGFITIHNIGQNISLYLPKGIETYVVDSIYN